MNKQDFFIKEKFDGTIQNQEVVQLRKEIDDLKIEYANKLKEKVGRIKQIQKECDHHYQLDAKGEYHDVYCCPLCGKVHEL